MVQLLVDLAKQMAAVSTAQKNAGGSKFGGELKGGPLDDFYKGVTGVCGEPDADIEEGMRRERTPSAPTRSSSFRHPTTGSPRLRPRSGRSCWRVATGVPRWRGKRAASS